MNLVVRFRALRALALLALLAVGSGCVVAAAGAGAGAAIAWTQRGASSLVAGTVDQLFAHGVAVFRRAEITQTGEAVQDQGNERRLVGTRGVLEFTVEIRRETDTTSRVEVYARRSALEWDRNAARDVLAEIIRASR